MADNVAVTEGSGKNIATDEVQVDGSHTSGQVQFVKMVDGTLNGTASIAVDVGVKANALRVAPANNITDATYIGDIKFGESLPAGTNAIGKLAANSGVDIGDVTLTAGTAAIGKLAANTGVDIGDVDVTSVIAGVGATNLGKARDSALGATDTGVMALAVRDDTLTTLTPVDGDYVPLRVGSTGKLHVTDANITACNTGAVVLSSGTVTTVSTVTAITSLDKSVYVDDADWVDNTSSHTLVGGIYQSSPHTVTDGDVSPFGVDVNGNIVLGTGAKAIGKLAANSGVDIGDVDITSIVPGVAATNLGKAEDAGHTSGDVGVMAMTVRQNTAAALSGTDADYQPLISDTNGRLHVLDQNSGAMLTALQIIDDWDDSDYCNVNMNIAGTDVSANAGVLTAQTLRVTIATDDECNNLLGTIDADTGAIKTAVEIIDDWDATHDSAASADGPQLMGAYDSTKPTAIGDGDAVRVLADAYGRLLAGVEPQSFQAVFDSADASAEANAVHASAASTIIVVQSYVISSDAEIWVKLQEEDSTALTGKFYLKAGGGVAITLPDKAPIVLGVDSDLEVITEGAGSISVSVTGYTIPG